MASPDRMYRMPDVTMIENKKEPDLVSAGGLVFQNTPEGRKWLIAKHSRAGHTSWPKGRIGDKDTIKSEEPEDAALREVLEETGVTAEILAEIPESISYWMKDEKGNNVLKSVRYWLMTDTGKESGQTDGEMSESGFYPEDQIAELLTYDNDKKVFESAVTMANQLEVELV